MGFVHLHNHTEYSFLDGVPTLPDLVNRVVDLGQNAVAMTDHGEVSGHFKFQKACDAKGIKPIFGLEGYFVDDVSERTKERAWDYEHVTFLAINDEGLHNLWALSSDAFIEGMYYKPRVDWDILKKYSNGLIMTSGCMQGCIATYFREEDDRAPDGKNAKYDPDRGIERINRFYEIFEDRLYFEIHTFTNDVQIKLNAAMAEAARNFDIPMIAVSDSHYLMPEDWKAHELLIAAQMGKKADDDDRFQYGPGALAVIGEEAVRQRIEQLPGDVIDECIENTQKIADMVDTKIEGKRTFPVFFNKSEDDIEYLKKKAWEGFDKRIHSIHIDEYKARLSYELDLVIKKNYAGYFLIVADMINWAKENDILIGPGRGSAGGSLLSFVLGITEIDPIKANLLFERFMDPTVEALPDIDVDVAQLERPEVRKYLESKYHVATIGTLITQAPRMLLRDFARVLDIPGADVNAMSEIISETKDLTVLDKSWETVWDEKKDEFTKPLFEDGKFKRQAWSAKYPELFDLMHKFAAHFRHAGAHAAGIVVSREDFMGKLPLRMKDDDIRTQMEAGDVEELGYVKMDLLGLRTLSTLMRALKLAQKNWTEDSNKPYPEHFYNWQYDWNKYYDDLNVYESLWEGKNAGIFQIETEGLTEIAKRYKPESIEDMCAVVSLFRPGITRTFDRDGKTLLEVYLLKREGMYPVTYKHPILEEILGNTYGAFLYQEQVMQVCRDMADFTPEEQAKVRKILGKTKPEEMKKMKEIFVERSVNNGVERTLAESIWGEMESFGVYGFNKSHGYAYGMIAYWCAWMKHYYPKEFMVALFQTNAGAVREYSRECRRLDIPVLAPDVNESDMDFTLVDGKIRYGLGAVKFVSGSSKSIISNRASHPYNDIDDFIIRNTNVNKRVLESLARVGAFDSLISDDELTMEALRQYTTSSISKTKLALWKLMRSKLSLTKGQQTTLSEADIYNSLMKWTNDDDMPDGMTFNQYADSVFIDDRAYNEVELLGDNVETTPFGEWMDLIVRTSNFVNEKDMWEGESCLAGGIIKRVRHLKTKKGKNPGQDMCQFWLEVPVIENDKVIDIDTLQIVSFPQTYNEFRSKIKEAAPVMARVVKLGGGGLMLSKIYRMDQDL